MLWEMKSSPGRADDVAAYEIANNKSSQRSPVSIWNCCGASRPFEDNYMDEGKSRKGVSRKQRYADSSDLL
jgi:hypothetical protein